MARFLLNQMSVTIVLGSGGHTSELLSILQQLPAEKYQKNISTVIYGKDDNLSITNFKNKLPQVAAHCRFKSIIRARKVGQGYLSSLFTATLCFLQSLRLALNDKKCSRVNQIE